MILGADSVLESKEVNKLELKGSEELRNKSLGGVLVLPASEKLNLGVGAAGIW